MPLANTYPDAYLVNLVTQARETKAIADVAALGTLPAAWATRLVILRAYIITCLESSRAPDDMFTVKLAAYRKEWPDSLAQARQAQAAVDAATGAGEAGASPFTVELIRG